MYFYDDYHNSERLCLVLHGDALNHVSGLINDPFGASCIMEALEERYGDVLQMIRDSLLPLQNSPNVKENDTQSLLGFCQVLNNTVAQLENNGGTTRLNDQTLLESAVSKIPLSFRTKWARHFVEVLGKTANLAQLALWTKTQCRYLRMAEQSGPAALSPHPLPARPALQTPSRYSSWSHPPLNRQNPPRPNPRPANAITMHPEHSHNESCPQCGHPAKPIHHNSFPRRFRP